VIVYYVGPGLAPPSDRIYARTRDDAHAIAKSMIRRDPVVVRAEVDASHHGVVDALNGEARMFTREAWTLSPRGGLRPLDLSEFES
jgi:hypothetical protein